MYRIKNNTGSTLYINGYPVKKGEISPLYNKDQILTCQSETDTLIVKMIKNSFCAEGNGKLFVEKNFSSDAIICISEKK